MAHVLLHDSQPSGESNEDSIALYYSRTWIRKEAARRGHHDWIPKSKITSCNHAAFFVSQIYGLPEWYCVANGLTTPSQRVFTGGRKGLNVVSVAASVSNSVVDDSPDNSITRSNVVKLRERKGQRVP